MALRSTTQALNPPEVSNVYPVPGRSRYFYDAPLPSLWPRHNAAGKLVPVDTALPLFRLRRTGAVDLQW